MKKIKLGNSGIEVSEICFGALPFGPLQKNLSVELCEDILSYALDNGVNFIDTAQLYKTYEPIKKALAKRTYRPIIATKSKSATYEDMEYAIKEAIDGMGIEYIDIFHLHSAEDGPDVFDIKKGALDCLLDYKKKGIVKAVGISTHNVKTVEASAYRDEIDIVFPIINNAGRGILGGTKEDMAAAISKCHKNGKGIYLMKVLGGGTLLDDFDSSMEYARSLGEYSIAIGMISREEVIYNIKYFNNEIDKDNFIKIRNNKIVKVSPHLCSSCSSCVESCHSDAVSLNEKNIAFIDQDKCLQCGYCIAACPSFAIRMI